MIPENGFKEQFKIDELPQWVIDLREGKVGEEIHKSVYQTRSGLEIYKVGEQYVIIHRYAPMRTLEALSVYVGDETKKNEEVGFDLRAEHEWERAEDMKADYYEELYDEKEDAEYDLY